jgi:hypothetical protein
MSIDFFKLEVFIKGSSVSFLSIAIQTDNLNRLLEKRAVLQYELNRCISVDLLI